MDSEFEQLFRAAMDERLGDLRGNLESGHLDTSQYGLVCGQIKGIKSALSNLDDLLKKWRARP